MIIDIERRHFIDFQTPSSISKKKWKKKIVGAREKKEEEKEKKKIGNGRAKDILLIR